MTMPSAMSGMFTTNAACQLKCSSRKPPIKGPAAMPRPEMDDQAASANARSFASVKMFLTMEMVAGMIMAPPTPRMARMAMMASGV